MSNAFSIKKRVFPILLIVLFLTINVSAKNTAELKIENISEAIRAGESFQFSFVIGNRLGPGCAAELQYWFEEQEQKLVQGNDTIYLESGESD